jgi:hypothetical protein
MQDLIEQMKKEAGLTNEQAIKAIEIMKGYIQTKVPPMFSGFVDKFFAKNNVTQDDDPLAL